MPRKPRNEMKVWGKAKINGKLKKFNKCHKCGSKDEHYGKGLCKKCYQSKYHAKYVRKDIENHRAKALEYYYKNKKS